MAADFDTGKFVISLDFELFWGVRDKRTIENYRANLLGVQQAIPAILSLFDKYGVKGTFSTVGFLFAKNKEELLAFSPAVKPEYINTALSPYLSLSNVGNDEKDDPYHFGYSLLKQIQENGKHEIGTHTYCHYYCLEPGQTPEAFKQDLLAAKKIAAKLGINARSLVFPRNQFNEEYISVCKEVGIDSYRGNPESWLYAERMKDDESQLIRGLRFLDAYINLTGHHCHSKKYVVSFSLVNLAGSRFLRPYSNKFSYLESIRLRRIKKALLHAAKNKKLFHLWWHPHNFGVNLKENINFLEQILLYYQKLKDQYSLSSVTMSGLTDELKNTHE